MSRNRIEKMKAVTRELREMQTAWVADVQAHYQAARVAGDVSAQYARYQIARAARMAR